MNVVLDEATEVYVKDAQPRKELGESTATVIYPEFSQYVQGGYY